MAQPSSGSGIRSQLWKTAAGTQASLLDLETGGSACLVLLTTELVAANCSALVLDSHAYTILEWTIV